MADTDLIRSGYDLELLLGPGWLLQALRALNEVDPFFPSSHVEIASIEILGPGANWDLQIYSVVDGIEIDFFANMELDPEADVIQLTTSLGFTKRIPFDIPDNVYEASLRRVHGAGRNQNAVGLFFLIDLRASPQWSIPLPEDEHAPRAVDLDSARSFLPSDQEFAIGMAARTFDRFANHIWHTQLRAPNGSHPFPSEDDSYGQWTSVRMEPDSDGIKVTLRAIAEVDTPVIDIVPDPHVELELAIQPVVSGSTPSFEIRLTHTDVDFQLLGGDVAGLGDIADAIVGTVLFTIIGATIVGFAPSALVASGAAALGAVPILVEIVELVVEGKVRRLTQARLPDGSIVSGCEWTCTDEDIVQCVTQENGESDSFLTRLLDAFPAGVRISSDLPDGFHRRTLVSGFQYQKVSLDASGLVFTGASAVSEWNEPLPVTLLSLQPDSANGWQGIESLTYLTYSGSDRRVTLPIDEVLDRVSSQRLATVCLEASAIRRSRTVVTHVRFSPGPELTMTIPQAVALQDARVIQVRYYQLIHPRDGNPYFRAPPDDTIENNFESLPDMDADTGTQI